MAALNFPTSPTLNQVYTANGYSWKWNGASWISLPTINGGTINGTTIGSTTPSTGAFTTLNAAVITTLGPDGVLSTPSLGAADWLRIKNNGNANIALVGSAGSQQTIKAYASGDTYNWAWLAFSASPRTVTIQVGDGTGAVPSPIASFASTGLAVTGTVSATSAITIDNPSYIGQGILSNGADYVVKLASDANLYLDAGGGAGVYQSINGTAVTQVTSTGLAVTGQILATNNGASAFPASNTKIGAIIDGQALSSLLSYGSNAGYLQGSAGGTRAAPSQTISGSTIGLLGGLGYDATNGWGNGTYTSSARIVFVATDNYTTTAQGSRIDFDVTPTGSPVTSRVNVASLSSTGLAVTGQMNTTGADAAYLVRIAGATGRFLFQPYFDATWGQRLFSLNTAESAYQPFSILASTIRLCNSSTVIAEVSSTGLAVTASGVTQAVKIGQLSSATTYGAISFNGTLTAAGITGIFGGGGGDNNLNLNVPTGYTVNVKVNDVNVTSTSSTGLAVTGTLSATGKLNVGAVSGGSSTAGDVQARRTATTGVYYFGDGNDKYLYFDGTSFNLTHQLSVTGAIYATGNITAYYSDERLKTRLGVIDGALSKVELLDGFYFEANETAQALGYEKKREIGVSAQQVEAVLPEIIAPAPIDPRYKTLDYAKLVPLLIEAIKELNAKVKKLESK